MTSKNTEPPESALNSRWMPYAKSDALMGVPSEYFMFGRSLSL